MLNLSAARASTWGPELHLARDEGAQCFVVLPNGDLIVSQGFLRRGQTKEDTVFSLVRRGLLLGSMVCPNAGHGTLFGYREDTKELVFDWAGKLVAAKWQPGTISRAKHTRMLWAKFQAGYVSCSINNDEGTVLLRISRETKQGRRDVWESRTLRDLDAGVDRVLGVVGPLPVTEPQMQGGVAGGGIFYHSTGHGNRAQLVTAYSLKTGKQVGQRPVALFDGGNQENQGLQLLDGMLLVLFTLNRAGRRTHWIKALSDPPAERIVYLDRLRRGQTDSESVGHVQAALVRAVPGLQLEVTKAYDAATVAAAARYQRQLGDSPADGILGPKQTARLFQDAELRVTIRENA